MKAIMISDKAKWCALMMNGDKNIEVRTSKALADAIQKLIDENGYADIYVYCTKDGELFYHVPTKKWVAFKGRNTKIERLSNRLSNGVVKFKFRCYKVEEHKDFCCMFPYSNLRYNKSTCLTEEEIEDYGFIDGKGYVPLYAIHISDLEIFDKPKELSEFNRLERHRYCIGCPAHGEECYFNDSITTSGTICLVPQPLTKAPQNFCYVEVK